MITQATALSIPPTVAGIDYSMTEANPEVPRWIYNPGVSGVHVNARETGIIQEHVPHGVPIRLNSFDIMIENHTMEENEPLEKIKRISAKDAADAIKSKLEGKGFVEFWAGQINPEEMLKYWAAVHPRLADVGIVCPFNEEDLDPRQICPTCLYEWLTEQSDCTHTFEKNLAKHSFNGVKKEVAEDLRKILIGSLREYIQTGHNEWSALAAEYFSEDGKMKKFATAHHELRKNIHVMRPQDRELHRTAVLGEAMAHSIGDAMRGANAQNNAMTPELISAIVSQTVAATMTNLGLVPQANNGKTEKNAKTTISEGNDISN
jgi:hypothetical protein